MKNAIGHAGNDPVVRQVGDSKVAEFAIVDKLSYVKDKTAPAVWMKLKLWGKLADVAENFVRKGTLVYVEGEDSIEIYETKTGETKASQVLRVGRLQLLGSKGGSAVDSEENDESAPAASTFKKPSATPVVDTTTYDTEDIPF